MEHKISYQSFIKMLNDFEIKSFEFSVPNYSHYRNCTILTKIDVLENGNTIPMIVVKLTSDGSEDVSFYKKFKEDYKMFRMRRKGSFTLEQMWSKISIKKLEFLEGNTGDG